MTKDTADTTKLSDLGRAITEKLAGLDRLLDETIDEIHKVRSVAIDKAYTRWLTKKEAAAYCGMALVTFNRRITAGNRPPHVNDGGKHKFLAEDLDAWMCQWKKTGSQTH